MKIDIQEIIANKIKAMEESNLVIKTIEETVEKSVLSAIKSAIDSYKFQRDIEDKVSNEVSNVVKQIGFTAYNGFIAEKIKQITENACHADVAEKIQKTFDEMLVMKRDRIKLSEICEAYRKFICENTDETEKFNLGHFHASIKVNEEYNWIDVEFAKEKSDRYSIDESINFTIHKDYQDKTTGTISRVYIDGYGIDKQINFGHMTSIEKLLVNITYNKTPIEIDIEDEDDIDNSFDVDIW